MNNKPGPDFVCIGAQKSGTTWLYENLARHAEVWVPPVKEFHYFDRVCVNDQLLGLWDMPHPHGIARYAGAFKSLDVKRLRWLRQYYRLGMDKAWYLDLFDTRYSGGKLCGEITPGYSTLEERGVKYARSVLGGDVHILFIVRNPVYRSWSAAKMLLRCSGINLASVLPGDLDDFLMSPIITLHSQYSRIVPLWKNYFDNFHILFYDQICQSPREFLSEISRILGVGDKWDENSISKRVWADDKKIPMPPAVIKALVAQYSSEIESFMSMNECAYVKSWQGEISRLLTTHALSCEP